MPVAFDTQEIYRFVFSTDRSKPIEQQPTLLFHYPTCREVRKIAAAFDAADKALIQAKVKDDYEQLEQSTKLRCDAMKVILCGWENFNSRDGKAIPFDADELDSVLTDNDFVELQANLLKEMSQSELEKKRHALLPQSTRASSVPNATVSA